LIQGLIQKGPAFGDATTLSQFETRIDAMWVCENQSNRAWAEEMVDVVGVEHVCIGTDQQVAPGSLQDYSQWVHLIAAMLRGGFTPEEAGKIAGGNYMRIFRVGEAVDDSYGLSRVSEVACEFSARR
jgi:Membrane dipeptidase (Peptidase family M19)